MIEKKLMIILVTIKVSQLINQMLIQKVVTTKTYKLKQLYNLNYLYMNYLFESDKYIVF